MSGIVSTAPGSRTREMDPVLAFCRRVEPNLAAGRTPRTTQGKAPAKPGQEDLAEARASQPSAKKQKRPAATAVESTVDKSTVDKLIVDDWAGGAQCQVARPAESAHAYGALAADVQAKEIGDLKQQLVAKVEENSALGEMLARVQLESAQAEGLAKANERHIKMLTEELAAARERSKHEAVTLAGRLDEARDAATLRASQQQHEKLREAQAQFEAALAASRATIAKTEAAAAAAVTEAKAEAEALRALLAQARKAAAAVEPAPPPAPAPARAAKKQRKSTASSSNSNSGRSVGLPEVPFQVAPEKLAEIKWEGNPDSGWILMDYGEVLVNVMTLQKRLPRNA